MQRYFLDQERFSDGIVHFDEEQAHHIGRVLRMKPGEELVVCDQAGSCFLASLSQVGPGMAEAKVVRPLEGVTELPVAVTIAQGLPKGDKWETVIQKGTECGAAAFIPVAMARSVAKVEPKKEARKLERWQKIAQEAAEQSYRQLVPVVSPAVSFKHLVSLANDFDVCLFAYEEAAKAGEKSRLKHIIEGLRPGMRLLVLVGPEGGISPEEAEILTGAGFIPCGLGPRILRTETAPGYVLAALSYAFEL